MLCQDSPLEKSFTRWKHNIPEMDDSHTEELKSSCRSTMHTSTVLQLQSPEYRSSDTFDVSGLDILICRHASTADITA